MGVSGGPFRLPILLLRSQKPRIVTMAKRRDMTDTFVQWGFDARGWSHCTRRSYAYRIRAADKWLRVHRGGLLRANQKDLAEYLASRPPCARTRNGIRAALVAFYAFTIQAGNRATNPATGIPRLREARHLPKALEADQAAAITRAAQAAEPMIAALVLGLLFQGLRREEARTLTWAQVERRFLRVRGKGARDRDLPVHEIWAAALVVWRAACTDPQWVFPSPLHPGRPVSTRWIGDRVKEVGQAARVKGLHPHQLRHTFATGMLDSGADVRDVQGAMGHSSIATTGIYLRVRPMRLVEAFARLRFEEAS